MLYCVNAQYIPMAAKSCVVIIAFHMQILVSSTGYQNCEFYLVFASRSKYVHNPFPYLRPESIPSLLHGITWIIRDNNVTANETEILNRISEQPVLHYRTPLQRIVFIKFLYNQAHKLDVDLSRSNTIYFLIPANIPLHNQQQLIAALKNIAMVVARQQEKDPVLYLFFVILNQTIEYWLMDPYIITTYFDTYQPSLNLHKVCKKLQTFQDALNYVQFVWKPVPLQLVTQKALKPKSNYSKIAYLFTGPHSQLFNLLGEAVNGTAFFSMLVVRRWFAIKVFRLETTHIGHSTSKFVENTNKEFVVLYCESTAPKLQASWKYWQGPYSLLSWLVVISGFWVLAGLTEKKVGKIFNGLFVVVRILFRQNVIKWTSKLNMLISFCCVLIQFRYEAAFTSQITVPPEPFTLESFQQLLKFMSGLKLVPDSDKRMEFTDPILQRLEENEGFTKDFYLSIYFSQNPELLEGFSGRYQLGYEQVENMFDIFVGNGSCGENPLECLQNRKVETVATIIAKENSAETIAKFRKLGGGHRWCHFVKRDFNWHVVGWTFMGGRGRHREMVGICWKLWENGIMGFWKKLESWKNEFVVVPKLGVRNNDTQVHRTEAKPNALMLKRNLLQLAEIYWILLAICLVAFGYEKVVKNWKLVCGGNYT